jgi:shikimate dehydrogenase
MAESSLQEVVCCLGQPVAGNPTQYMMEKAFAAAGLDWRYLTCEVSPEKLGDAMRGIRALGFKGANFTIPHKVAVIEYLDGLSPAAELMGAVNCANRVADKLTGDKLFGDNADGRGFLRALREICDPAGQQIVILGAGGAARAIAVELALAGAGPLTIVNRTVERGEALASLINDRTSGKARFAPLAGSYAIEPEAAVLVNATSIGLNDPSAQAPIDIESLRPDLVVADVVFNPPETWLLRTAADRACRTLDGLGMLINQAVICFKIWTGIEPDAGVMRDALEEFLEI